MGRTLAHLYRKCIWRQGRNDKILEVLHVWIKIWESFDRFFDVDRYSIFPHFGSLEKLIRSL